MKESWARGGEGRGWTEVDPPEGTMWFRGGSPLQSEPAPWLIVLSAPLGSFVLSALAYSSVCLFIIFIDFLGGVKKAQLAKSRIASSIDFKLHII